MYLKYINNEHSQKKVYIFIKGEIMKKQISNKQFIFLLLIGAYLLAVFAPKVIDFITLSLLGFLFIVTVLGTIVVLSFLFSLADFI